MTEQPKRRVSAMKSFFALSPLIFLSAFCFSGCTVTHPVKAVRAAFAPVESTITTISSGTVAANQQAVLSFGTIGRINEVLVRAGDKVKKNQRLASLENLDLKVADQTAQAELRRTRDLAREKLVSPAALDEARRAAEMAQMTFDRSIILAPFDGLVTEVNLRKGEIAQAQSAPDKPPIRLIDLKPRLVKGEIDEVDLGKVKVGLEARVKIPALENKRFKARVTSVVAFVSSNREQDRTSQIELQFDDSEDLIPVGASADVEILIAKKERALTVPARSVLGTVKQRYVYKVVDEHIERSNVTVGVGNYDRREILSGVKEGDVVVVPSDDYDLKSADKVKVTGQPWP
jgi:HlyD family secretion protein